MKNRNCRIGIKYLMSTLVLAQGISFSALAHEGENHTSSASLKIPKLPVCQILTAKQLFDGVNFPKANMAVLIKGNKVNRVGTPKELLGLCKNRINLGDATILPGFIESHAHITFQNVSKDTVLEHGITTAQDTGGKLLPPKGGQGTLRLLSVGPIIQAEGGYPLNIFTQPSPGGPYDQIGYPISATSTEKEVKGVVKNLVNGGATAIKIALEPGGEAGAPWMQPHDGPVPKTPWAMLSLKQVQWIVAQAHVLGKRVIAHVGEQKGFDLAVKGGIDELAHMPCAEISEASLHAAVEAGVTFVTTIDTLGSCAGIHANAHAITHVMAHNPKTVSEFIYGSEVAHDNVPWGINGEEMHLMLHLTHGEGDIEYNDVVNVFRSATSRAGENLGIDKLGTLTPGAPADIIAVKGNPFKRFKILEYPDLVMSGGRTIVNKFKK